MRGSRPCPRKPLLPIMMSSAHARSFLGRRSPRWVGGSSNAGKTSSRCTGRRSSARGKRPRRQTAEPTVRRSLSCRSSLADGLSMLRSTSNSSRSYEQHTNCGRRRDMLSPSCEIDGARHSRQTAPIRDALGRWPSKLLLSAARQVGYRVGAHRDLAPRRLSAPPPDEPSVHKERLSWFALVHRSDAARKSCTTSAGSRCFPSTA